jgi:hypothetical protein
MLHLQQICSKALLKVVLSNSRSEGRQPGGGVPTDALFLTRPAVFAVFTGNYQRQTFLCRRNPRLPEALRAKNSGTTPHAVAIYSLTNMKSYC